ncbi:phosphoribosyl 1,2-cyclic phosphodiesterase [Azospirillum agricola]|uniref:MBL fold metallo-hydrolase n=1 Tax=Azospirillum agricola TaxID=1720247 RepID=UPI001AE7F2AB|nr:MBL fold metallo-hydrolase [Azospirillum agricola]MBP2227045.1 phosphoribosyl 1,2-cyclic phosphodiesterase [Azospirillum agricola]
MGFTVTFWGVRGTIPCPAASHLGFGGNTACVELRVGAQRIILDAGTGLRPLGRRLLADGVGAATLLLSHTHLDHISGFPFFAPAYAKGFGLRVVAGHTAGRPGIEAVMARQMERPLFPVPMRTMGCDLSFIEVPAGHSFKLEGGVRVHTAALNHPDGATGYRIEHQGRSMAYVTDTEHVPDQPDRNILNLVDGVDLLIYDATYTDEEWSQRVGWGHSTWTEAVRIARAGHVRRLCLFHHDPDHDDRMMEAIEAAAQAELPNCFAAREGTTVTLA